MPSVAHRSTVGLVVHSLVQHRLERALRERERYRYVRPQVLQEGECFRVQSPNCSRNIDSSGGVIDIALLVPHSVNRWCLCARDHANARWQPLLQDAELDAALELLCVDPDRRFWP